MRVNGFRCDVCCKEHLLDPTLILQSYREELPAEWFMLSQGPYKQDKPWDQQEPRLFCSVACLAQWAEKQVIAAVPHIAEHAKLVAKDWVFKEAAPSSTEVFEGGLVERLQALEKIPYKTLAHSNWLPGDEE